MTVPSLATAIGPACRDEQRRAVLSDPTLSLNGIDFVEYELRKSSSGDHHVLVVHFLKSIPNDAYGLTAHPEWVQIEGGARIVGIQVLPPVRLENGCLEIEVDQAGDFSAYELFLGWQRRLDGRWERKTPDLDWQFSRAPINFKAGCSVDFDCRKQLICPPDRLPEPLIDYLAKDYASFRQLLLDQLPQLNPKWQERNPADLGITLVELLAYAGDHLSYFQDAVANEAYLDTARQRVSVKRHAHLIDYRMHEGRNAWTFAHIAVGQTGTIPQHTQLLSQIVTPLRNEVTPPAVVIPQSSLPGSKDFEHDPALAQVQVFETTFPLQVDPKHNTIYVHTWGNRECCLPRGATSAYLYTVDPQHPSTVTRPELKIGDYLLLEEVKSSLLEDAANEDAANADLTHRWVVQLIAVEQVEDPVYRRQRQNGHLQIDRRNPPDPMPLLWVAWRSEDALPFPFCLSTQPSGKDPILNRSVARGNIVLADQGRTVVEEIQLSSPVPPDQPFRLRLGLAPLTYQCQPDTVNYEPATARLQSPRMNLAGSVQEAQPAIALRIDFPSGPELWTPVPDLLDSHSFDQHFVVDLDENGRATLRFGDGEYGREPARATKFTATYRVGNGRRGNIGAESLVHIVQPTQAAQWPQIQIIRNPLAARGGVDPETLEEVRQLAPAAFRAEQFRAVTEADYVTAAQKMPDVAGAVATLRWTGSWYTVLVGIDPRNPEDLITEPGGLTRLSLKLEQHVRNFLTRYKLAGYDLEVRSAQYVPLELNIDLCVATEYFRGDVAEAVRQALSNRVNPDGSLGFFHPDRFTFAQAVYLSQIYAAVEAVEGVGSLVITRFQRYGQLDNGELESGVLTLGPWEIARLDNDPNFMENGVLQIIAKGGR